MLTTGSRDSMQRRAVLGGEQLHGSDESGRVGAKVGKEEGLRTHARKMSHQTSICQVKCTNS